MKVAMIIFMGVICMSLFAQSLLNGPEGVTWDPIGYRYFVANYSSNNIIAIDLEGNETVYAEGTTQPLGVLVHERMLYVTGNNPPTLYGYSLDTDFLMLEMGIDNCLACAELCADDSGNLYIADQGGKIHKIDLAAGESEVWISGGMPSGPQGVAYDPAGERLIVACYGSGPIKAFDINTQEAENLISSAPGQFIQICMDSAGKVYLSCWNGNRVYWFQPGVVDELHIITGLVTRPSGLYANESTGQLAVASFASSNMNYFPLSMDASQSDTPELNTLITVSPNPFNPETTITYNIPVSSSVSMNVYNARGQRITTLVDQNMEAGTYKVVWNGTDNVGKAVSSGVYLLVLKYQGKELSRKMVLMK